MNAFVLLLAAAAVGVDYGWQPTSDGQLEYIVQIEPVTLVAMRSGQELVSQLDPYVRNVRRFRVRVGTDLVPRRGMPPTGAVPQKNLPIPQGVQYGWQPLDRNQSEFIIQVSHARLQMMRNGDEIVGEIPPEVLNLVQLRVRAGDGAVPRLGLQTASATMPAEQQPVSTNQASPSGGIPASIIARPPKAGPPEAETASPLNLATGAGTGYPQNPAAVAGGNVQPAPPLTSPPATMPTLKQGPTLRIGDSMQPGAQSQTPTGQAATASSQPGTPGSASYDPTLPSFSPQRADASQQPNQNQLQNQNQNPIQYPNATQNQYQSPSPYANNPQNPNGSTPNPIVSAPAGANPGSTVSTDSASQRRVDGWNGQDFSAWPPPPAKAGPSMYQTGSTPGGVGSPTPTSATPMYNSQNQPGVAPPNRGYPENTASQPPSRPSNWSTVGGPAPSQQPAPPMVSAPPSQPVYGAGNGYGHPPGTTPPAQNMEPVYGRSYPGLPPLPGMDSGMPRLPWEDRVAGRDSATKKSELSQEFWASLGGVASDPSLAFLAGSSSADSGDRPWGPLALTMMLLFISLGANLYIGWIAMDMYQRYLEMADDLSDDDSIPRRPSSRERSSEDDDEDEEQWGGNYRRRRERSGVAA